MERRILLLLLTPFFLAEITYALDIRLFFPEAGRRSRPHIEFEELISGLVPGNTIEFSTPIIKNGKALRVTVGQRLDQDSNPHFAIFEIKDSPDEILFIPKKLGATLNPQTGSYVTTRDSLIPFQNQLFSDLVLGISEVVFREGEYAIVRFDTKGGTLNSFVPRAAESLGDHLVERVLPKTAWTRINCKEPFRKTAD